MNWKTEDLMRINDKKHATKNLLREILKIGNLGSCVTR